MPRRVSMPGADELFRATAREGLTDVPPVERDSSTENGTESAAASGRVKRDEKMTVYVTADELLAVEHARLQLRVALGRTVDRGRFVRAAVALALADLEEHGVDSQVARRLSET